MMEIYSLRVKKSRAGVVFPFDRVYLTDTTNKEIFKQLFRYALVMPVTGVLKKKFYELVPDGYEDHPFNRNISTHKPVIKRADWLEFIKSGHWVMAVPLLTKWSRENNRLRPSYLTAKRWHKQRGPKTPRMDADAFPNSTHLQTPEKDIRPVCLFCPRFIMHQNGACNIGEDVCFSALPLGLTDHFKEGLSAPTPERNMKRDDELVLEDDT